MMNFSIEVEHKIVDSICVLTGNLTTFGISKLK